MRETLTLTLIILMAIPVFGASSSVEDLQKEIVELQRTAKNQRKTIAKLRKKVSEQEKELKRLRTMCRRAGISTNTRRSRRDDPNIIGESFSWPLAVGQAAYLSNHLQVKEVLDKMNYIATIQLNLPIIWKYNEGGQLVTKSQPSKNPLIWIMGIETSNYENLHTKKLEKVRFRITGTRKFYGSTLFVFEPIY